MRIILEQAAQSLTPNVHGTVLGYQLSISAGTVLTTERAPRRSAVFRSIQRGGMFILRPHASASELQEHLGDEIRQALRFSEGRHIALPRYTALMHQVLIEPDCATRTGRVLLTCAASNREDLHRQRVLGEAITPEVAAYLRTLDTAEIEHALNALHEIEHERQLADINSSTHHRHARQARRHEQIVDRLAELRAS